jgi:hypothetical protein
MRIGLATLATILIVASSVSSRAAMVSREDFQVETTANLVSLCIASNTDPLYTAAQNFCHGFAVGTYRAIVAEQMATKAKTKMFCAPPTPPTREKALADFVQWASARPKTLASSPTDGIAEYLASQYPCR